MQNAATLFKSAYSEDWAAVSQLLERHPTLVLYTISSWNEETWIHKGLRQVNRMGFLLATTDAIESVEIT
jgi:hypothetical protein